MGEKTKRKLIGNKFEEFVLSVVNQICIRENKTLFRGFKFQKNTDIISLTDPKAFSERKIFSFSDIVNGREINSNYLTFEFDAYAPYGFGDFNKPVIIEIKYNISNMKFIDLVDENVENVISLYIINQKLTSKELEARIKGKNVVVWDGNVIEQWRTEFPIDYYGYLSDDMPDQDIIQFDFKIESNKKLLRQAIENRKVSICLGAGVSYDYGALGWDTLISEFYNEMVKEGIVVDINKVQKKIGGTSIINGQFAEDNLRDFMSSLWIGLYGKYLPGLSSYKDTALEAVTLLIQKLSRNRRFNVITYNYDDYLEQCLSKAHIKYNVIYNEQNELNEEFTIYHPHGYFPFTARKSDYKELKKYLVFSETEYHKLYNDPYSWAMVLQYHLYRENVFLFVGCSLSDPNLRRILDTTKVPGKLHYALMLTNNLDKKDQLIVHRHFMRMGVECIWADTVFDLIQIIKNLI